MAQPSLPRRSAQSRRTGSWPHGLYWHGGHHQLARAWRERLGDYGQPTNARGKPVGDTMLAAGQQPPYGCKASVSGMAGTPACSANICKCHGGFIAERRVEDHLNAASDFVNRVNILGQENEPDTNPEQPNEVERDTFVVSLKV